MENEKSIVKITEDELTTLMLESTNENFLTMKYGIGWVALESVPGNAWALKRIAEIRGIEVK